MLPNNNINIPYSSFINPVTGRPNQEWLLWLMNPSFITLNLGSALPVKSGGTGLTTIPTNGQLLIGNGTGYTLDTLTAGVGIAIANAPGSITISASSTLVTKTVDFTVADTDVCIINNKAGATCVATFPSAAIWPGREITVQNYQDQFLVSASSNVVPQGGGAAGTAILLDVSGNWSTLVSDGINWIIMRAGSYNNLLWE